MNRNNIIITLTSIVIFIATYTLVTCAWVGAEYILDKAVHTSSVDRSIATALTYYITRDVYKLNRKYGGKRK